MAAFIIRLSIVVLLAATVQASIFQSKPTSPKSLLSSPIDRELAVILCQAAWTQHQKKTRSYHITGNCNDMMEATLQVEVDGSALIYIYYFGFRGVELIYLPVEITLRYRKWWYVAQSKNNDGEIGFPIKTWVDEVIVTRDREL
ncbi:hypothetical protein AXF42_Ash016322 [Apostasia shenzhenica]|uniref:Uncharacterized protein n=1 Tax=Apostasia shenzhenica TaxID=1088818 RepID=A0A2H9ZXE0_9ASPA|nr:hypothetical protein AXF42_Ash016322 [Apostasia shenzhenica]